MANALMKEQNPGTRLFMFIAFFFVLLIVGALAATGIAMAYFEVPFEQLENFLADYTSDKSISALGFINAATQIVGFLFSSILFLFVFGKKSVNGFWLKFTGSMILLTPIIVLLANPIIGITMEFNNWLIPEGGWLESIFKPMEEKAAITTEALLRMPDVGALLKNVLIIAIIPAVCEELVFRGVLQGQFAKVFKNVHVAIWVSAFIFSAIHLQFYGFIPRMLLGALLGYLLIWTGSIWAPILAHFTNNFMAILASYYVQHNTELTEEMFEQQTNTLSVTLIGLVLFTGILWYFWKNSKWEEIKVEYLSS